MNTYGPNFSLPTNLPIDFDIPKNETEFKELVAKRERLTASVLNVKENGLYDKVELQSGKQYFSVTPYPAPKKKRAVFRKVFDFVELNGGNLVAGTTYTFAHGITPIVLMSDISGSATTTTPDYLPLPFVSATTVTDQIEIYADNTNVYMIVGATQSNLIQAYVVLEVIKGNG
jgi:hypothetical protein